MEENKEILISNVELDALKETANIGTGNASIALSNLMKKKVGISLPFVNFYTSDEIGAVFAKNDQTYVGLYSPLKEGISGNLLMLLPVNSARGLVNIFNTSKNKDTSNLTETDKEILSKIGTALYSSYLTSISKFFRQKITFDTPKIVASYGDSLKDFILLQIGSKEKVMLIKVSFNVETTEISGDFNLLFTMQSLESILKRIKATKA